MAGPSCSLEGRQRSVPSITAHLPISEDLKCEKKVCFSDSQVFNENSFKFSLSWDISLEKRGPVGMFVFPECLEQGFALHKCLSDMFKLKNVLVWTTALYYNHQTCQESGT